MKALIVSNFLPPKIGGIERFSHELASALRVVDGIRVTVVSAKWPTKFIRTDWGEVEYPYEVIYIPSITLFKRLPIPQIYLPRFWSQLRLLRRDFDLVVYQSHLFILNWIIAMYLRKVTRRVWMNHGCNYVPVDSKIGQLLSCTYERIGMAVMKRFSNEHVGQSKNTANWIESKVGIPFQVLSNAINLTQFEEHRNFEEREKKTKVLFVGRLVEGKGLLECIDAISRANLELTKTGDSDLFTLEVVGGGQLRQKFSSGDTLVEISWSGEMNHSEVLESMYQSDILIQAYSQPEGLTTVTLEGLATGMLIVTTPLSGEGDLDSCTNYKAGSLHELPSLLLEARSICKKRNQLIQEGRQFLESGLTWDIIAQKLIYQDYQIK